MQGLSGAALQGSDTDGDDHLQLSLTIFQVNLMLLQTVQVV